MMLIQAARTRVRHADITRRTRHDWTHASAGQETQGLHRRRSRRTCLHPLAPTRRDHHHLAGLLRIPHRLAQRHRIHPAVPHSIPRRPRRLGLRPLPSQHRDLHRQSSHTSKVTKAWLRAHSRFHVHHTPTHASWLNMVEIWFSILTRKVLRRGEFPSREDLADKIIKFACDYDDKAQPFRWTYDGRPLKACLLYTSPSPRDGLLSR